MHADPVSPIRTHLKEVFMRTIVLAGLAALLATASLAQAADTLVSPGLPTVSDTSGVCYFRNVGTTPIALTASIIQNFVPDSIDPTIQTCNDAPLAPGRTCVVFAETLPADVTFECSAVVPKNSKNLRATAELRRLIGHSFAVIASQELQ
jgi:hypothetical protein